MAEMAAAGGGAEAAQEVEDAQAAVVGEEQERWREEVQTGVYARFDAGAGLTAEAVIAAVEAVFGGVQAAESKVDAVRGQGPVAMAPEQAEQALAAGKVDVDGVEVALLPLKRRRPRGKRNDGQQQQQQGQAAGELEGDPCGIYVRGLPEDVSKEQLREAFSQFGEVRSVEMRKRRSRNGLSLNVFLTFSDSAAVDAAMDSIEGGNPVKIGDATLEVERRKSTRKAPHRGRRSRRGGGGGGNGAVDAGDVASADASNARNGIGNGNRGGGRTIQKKSVYISNLEHGTQEAALRSELESYGPIESISIRQRETFASVAFATPEERQVAMQAAKSETGLSFGDARLRADPWRSGGRSGSNFENALHVTGFGNAVPSQEEVKAIFSSFGDVTDVEVRPTRTFGLVEFQDAAHAATVLEGATESGLNLPSQDGEALVVELSDNSRNSRRRPGRRRGGARGRGGGRNRKQAGDEDAEVDGSADAGAEGDVSADAGIEVELDAHADAQQQE